MLAEAVAGLGRRSATPTALAALLVARATVLRLRARPARRRRSPSCWPAAAAGAGASGDVAGRVRLRRAQLEAWRSGPRGRPGACSTSRRSRRDDPGRRRRRVVLRARGAEAVALALSGRAGESVRALADGPVRCPSFPGAGPARAGARAHRGAADLGRGRGSGPASARPATARAQLPLVPAVVRRRPRPDQPAARPPRLALWWHREQLGLARLLGQRLPAALAASGMMTAAAWLGDQAAMRRRRHRLGPRRLRPARSLDVPRRPGSRAGLAADARRRPGGRARAPRGGAGRRGREAGTSPRRRTRRTTGCGSVDPADVAGSLADAGRPRRRPAAGSARRARGGGGGRRPGRARAAAEQTSPGLGWCSAPRRRPVAARLPRAVAVTLAGPPALRRRRALRGPSRPRAPGRRRCSPAGPVRPTGSPRGSARSPCWSPRAAVQGDRRGARPVGPYRRQPPAAGLRQARRSAAGPRSPPRWGRSAA